MEKVDCSVLEGRLEHLQQVREKVIESGRVACMAEKCGLQRALRPHQRKYLDQKPNARREPRRAEKKVEKEREKMNNS